MPMRLPRPRVLILGVFALVVMGSAALSALRTRQGSLPVLLGVVSSDCVGSDGGKAGCECATVADCNDGNVCTTDACEALVCTNTANSVECRAASGTCDIAESCSGGACPANAFQAAGTVCLAASGACDAADTCNGSGVCTSNFVPGGTCRASTATCDPAESCTGSSTDCPADTNSCVCGDGIRSGSEGCDDGNTAYQDGCSGNCVIEHCGDGITQNLMGEQCDDANADANDGCDNCVVHSENTDTPEEPEEYSSSSVQLSWPSSAASSEGSSTSSVCAACQSVCAELGDTNVLEQGSSASENAACNNCQEYCPPPRICAPNAPCAQPLPCQQCPPECGGTSGREGETSAVILPGDQGAAPSQQESGFFENLWGALFGIRGPSRYVAQLIVATKVGCDENGQPVCNSGSPVCGGYPSGVSVACDEHGPYCGNSLISFPLCIVPDNSSLNQPAGSTPESSQTETESLVSACQQCMWQNCTTASSEGSASSSDEGSSASASSESSSSSAECGNGWVEEDEECDDGNEDDGDGCSGCVIDDGWNCDNTDAIQNSCPPFCA